MPIFKSNSGLIVKSFTIKQMATNNNSNRYPSGKRGKFFKGKTFFLLVGLLLGAGIMGSRKIHR